MVTLEFLRSQICLYFTTILVQTHHNLNQQTPIDSKHKMTALKEFKKPSEFYKETLTPNTICSVSVYVS